MIVQILKVNITSGISEFMTLDEPCSKLKLLDTFLKFNLYEEPKERLDLSHMYGTDMTALHVLTHPAILYLDGKPFTHLKSGHYQIHAKFMENGLHTMSIKPT